MSAKELQEMENPVTRGAKSGDPLKKVDDSTSQGASASYEDLGEDVEIKTHRDGSHYLYLEDPDGNVLEKIYWDR